jgi:hypothetical protein
MTLLAGVEGLDPWASSWAKKIGRSWILLLGLIPFDYDDLTLVELVPNCGFLERSQMMSQRSWEHERTLEPAGENGCSITDRVRWQPRLGLPGAPAAPANRLVLSPTATSAYGATSAVAQPTTML